MVITSATIDPDLFAQHFGDAPVLEVSGRTCPAEVRYRPPDPDGDTMQALGEAIGEPMAEGPGDVLVFLSGEREIRDAADALGEHLSAGQRARGEPVEIVPLYGRLSAAEQHRVFAPHTGRRVVLATNVAETSLTVPGIRYVVDAGTAAHLAVQPAAQDAADAHRGRVTGLGQPTGGPLRADR